MRAIPARNTTLCTTVLTRRAMVNSPSRNTAGIMVAANCMKRCGDWDAKPIATTELDSADM